MKNIPVILFGVGGVGAELVRQIVATREVVEKRNGLHFSVVAIVDSRNWLFDPSGLTHDDLSAAMVRKENREPLSDTARPAAGDLITQVHDAGVGQAIIIDVTAVDGMEPALVAAMDRGDCVVFANKKAQAGPWETAKPFFNNLQVRHESTVGGGQPVIATMDYLVDIQDDIYSVEGQMSGTLGFICQQLDAGVPFSAAVRDAKSRGYTEPDPREDLSGTDVLRKVMILGRMAGWPLEESDFTVEPLYPAELADVSVDEFMERIEMIDEEIAQRVAEAKVEGNVLRYIGRVTSEGGPVGLLPITATNPLGSLKFIKFHTKFYSDDPLIICGKGAGVEMTAGGVLGDMILLGREQF